MSSNPSGYANGAITPEQERDVLRRLKKDGGELPPPSVPKSIFDDEDYADELVNLLVYEQSALERCSNLQAEDFKPMRGMKWGKARWIVAERALDFFQKHGEPAGKMIRVEAQDYARRTQLGEPVMEQIGAYLDNHLEKNIRTKPSPPESILEKVETYLKARQKAQALSKFIMAQNDGTLTDELWHEIFESANIPRPEEAVLLQAPTPLKRVAFQGLAGEIVRACYPHTEANRAHLLNETLCIAGNLLPPDLYWMHGDVRHGLNLFVALVGPSGSGKGDGSETLLSILNLVDRDWADNPNRRAGLSSGEGLVRLLRDPSPKDPGVTDKRLLIVEEEFANVLTMDRRQGNNLQVNLRLASDGRTLAVGSIKGQKENLRATRPHLSLIVHITPDELRALISQTMLTNGFLNRFLLVFGNQSKDLILAPPMPEDTRLDLAARLRHVMEFWKEELKNSGGKLFMAPETDRLLETVWPTVKRYAGVPVTGRAKPHLRKLLHIYAALDCERYARPEHLEAAMEVLRYDSEGAYFTLGRAPQLAVFPEAERILEFLRKAGQKGKTRTEISKELFQKNTPGGEIDNYFQVLRQQGRIIVEKTKPGPQGGRGAERWRAV